MLKIYYLNYDKHVRFYDFNLFCSNEKLFSWKNYLVYAVTPDFGEHSLSLSLFPLSLCIELQCLRLR
jgi:hypothetical protein